MNRVNVTLITLGAVYWAFFLGGGEEIAPITSFGLVPVSTAEKQKFKNYNLVGSLSSILRGEVEYHRNHCSD